MIRHVVLFKYKDDTSMEAREEMARGLGSLPGKIAAIRSWSQGANCLVSDRNYDFCLIGDFDSLEDLQSYQNDPAHQDVVVNLIRPIAASVSVVDFEL